MSERPGAAPSLSVETVIRFGHALVDALQRLADTDCPACRLRGRQKAAYDPGDGSTQEYLLPLCGPCMGDPTAKLPVTGAPSAPPEPSPDALRLVLDQAEDEGLWGQAETAMEAYVQAALRELHAAVERAALGSGVPAATPSEDDTLSEYTQGGVAVVVLDGRLHGIYRDYDRAMREAFEQAVTLNGHTGLPQHTYGGPHPVEVAWWPVTGTEANPLRASPSPGTRDASEEERSALRAVAFNEGYTLGLSTHTGFYLNTGGQMSDLTSAIARVVLATDELLRAATPSEREAPREE